MLLLVAGLGLAGAAWTVLSGDLDLPDVAEVTDWTPRRASRILAPDGRLLTEIGPERRTPAAADRIPERVAKAVVAGEDERFFLHRGVDPWAIARAAWANLQAGRVVQGGSTITQQLAKAVLGPERSWRRKLREAAYARQIEAAMGKQEILLQYLNRVYFGRGAYGVAEAARAWFRKPLERVTLAEAAFLAGLPQRPSAYAKDPAAAARRRDHVLERMVAAGWITAAEDEAARAEPLAPQPRRPSGAGDLAYAVESVRRTMPDRLQTEGLTVELTVDVSASRLAQRVVREAAEALAGRRAARPAEAAEPGQAAGRIEGALISIDPASGAVLAWIGGRDFGESQFDRAGQACRQPGSLFKPIVYSAALALPPGRRLTPATLLTDAPLRGEYQGEGLWYRPRNFEERYRGPVILARALAESRNSPSIEVLRAVGAHQAADWARRLGVASPLDPVDGLVLGGSCVRPTELVKAFSALANRGVRRDPHLVARITDPQGRTLLDRREPWQRDLPAPDALQRMLAPSTDPPPAIDPATAAVTDELLRSVARSGTARTVLKDWAWPANGKTGTSDKYDAWFAGRTARMLTVLWLGDDKNDAPLGQGETGAKTALPAWFAFMSPLHDGLEPIDPWDPTAPPPPGVTRASVDPRTGQRTPAKDDSPPLPFLAGTAPRSTSDRTALYGASAAERRSLDF